MGTTTSSGRDRLAFALDVSDVPTARRWVDLLRGEVGVFKVGLELFIHAGPDAISIVRDSGARCFLDLKLHDIPETVARAVRSALKHRVDFLTIHGSGGTAMLKAAEAARVETADAASLLAITVLTSMDARAVREVGFVDAPAETAMKLAALAIDAGVGGLVCSAHEVAALRARFPSAMLVTPGIRPAGAPLGDQSRVSTAGDAIRAGADLLVVGRPIRDSADPLSVARALVSEIEGAVL